VAKGSYMKKKSHSPQSRIDWRMVGKNEGSWGGSQRFCVKGRKRKPSAKKSTTKS